MDSLTRHQSKTSKEIQSQNAATFFEAQYLLYFQMRKAVIVGLTDLFDMSITKVSRKGQITLHKAVRRKLGIEPGDVLEEEVEDGRIILRLSESPSVSLRGIGKKTKKRLRIDSTELVRRMRSEDSEEY